MPKYVCITIRPPKEFDMIRTLTFPLNVLSFESESQKSGYSFPFSEKKVSFSFLN